MKKIYLTFFTLLFVVVLFAQNPEKKWAIGLGPGVNNNLENNDLHFLGNAYLSRYLSPSFDLMLDNRAVFYKEGVDLITPLLNLRYKLSNGYIFKENSAVQPYLFGGVGYMWDNQADGANFDGGAGIKFPISSNTSLFVAGSYVKGIEGTRIINGAGKTVTDNHLQVTSIIEFAIGGSKDSDGDGVSDKKDKCPGTPAGVTVDEQGCPIDRDEDGVPDYKDDCPDIPGEKRFNGCPDRDGDGISDKDDSCPDIPGLAKFKGCPDSDKDGVPDNKDKCPDTPVGCSVDNNGCPLDNDNDGVIDCEDNCPTVKGPTGNKGCPIEEKIELGPVYFDLDQDILKPKAKAVLDKVAEVLSSGKGYDVVIAGHACDLGTKMHNQDLSERRAKAVVKYLIQKGVNNVYVGSNGYGEIQPALPNTSESNRQKNRRAELLIELK